MPSNIALGKELRNVRSALSMTQPRFAKWLSQATGEKIKPIKVCRMENFGARDACHPERPSSMVSQIVRPYILQKKTVGSNIARIKSKSVHYAPSQSSSALPSVNTNSKRASVMTEEQKQLLREFAGLYDELGVLDAAGETAAEMIEAVEEKIRDQAGRLVGDATVERKDIENRLKEIAEERAKINAERQRIVSELKQQGISEQTLARS